MIGKKTCTKCKENKPKTSKYFKPHPKLLDGFNGACRECINKNAREYKSTDKWKRWLKKDMLEHPEKYAAGIKRSAATRKARLETDEEYRKEYLKKQKEYNKNARPNTDFTPEQKKQRLLNTKRWIERNPERTKEIYDNYRKNNKDRLKQMSHERIKLMTDGYIIHQLLRQNPILEKQDFTPAIIETKRSLINLKRAIRDGKESNAL